MEIAEFEDTDWMPIELVDFEDREPDELIGRAEAVGIAGAS